MELWKSCTERLETELSAQQFNTWIRPLQQVEDNSGLRLFAPNRFVLDWVRNHYLELIKSFVADFTGNQSPIISLEIGSK
ncbi:MAG: chromosomal replication initiator protein DnaA, partial [Gammaproteobacteria bacterium]|nr:chromosomal replication initiator protein DnaA [Gammaproteobacteria bacterium]